MAAFLGRQAASSALVCTLSSSTALLSSLPFDLLMTLAANLQALRCKSSTSSANTKARKGEVDELAPEQQVERIYAQLKQYGCSRRFASKLVSRRMCSPRLVQPNILQERISMLWRVTQAETLEEQKEVMKRIYHVPEVLNYLPESLSDKAEKLAQLMQRELGIEQPAIQDLIVKQPCVLTFKSEALVQKLQEMAQRLQLQPQQLLQLWMKQRSLVNMSTAGLDAKLAELRMLLHLDQAALAKLITAQPNVLVSKFDTVQQRLAAVKACLNTWSDEQLGQGLVKYGSVLTYKPETIRYKWQVINAYAAMHEPSKQQLQQRLESATVFNLLTRPNVNIQLLEYIMHLQRCSTRNGKVRSSTHKVRNAAAITSAATSKYIQQQADGCVDSEREGASGAEVFADGMPLLTCAVTGGVDHTNRFIAEHYPGFWKWQQQQQKQAAHDK